MKKAGFLTLAILAGAGLLSGCSAEVNTAEAEEASTCETLTGTAWTPNVAGASAAHHDATAVITKDTYTSSGPLIGLDQAYNAGHVITVSGIDMNTDLLANGSLSLVAEVTGFPSQLVGSAYPVLVSLTDGTNEWTKVGTGCEAGFLTCSGGLCAAVKSACAPAAGSAYLGSTNAERQTNWIQHQFAAAGASVNTFPTCNWSTGTPTCAFDSTFFSAGKLRTGTYTAKYVLVASRYSSLPAGYNAGLKLSVIRKKQTAPKIGALDINVIIVGTKNIKASRTAKGQENLNALLNLVSGHYLTENSATTNVKIGTVSAIEWNCEAGGDSYSTVSVADLYPMFAEGSSMVPSSSSGKAINVFLVSSITGSSGGGGTILGLSGGIGGSPIHGTRMSGVAFSTFDKLDTYNPICNGSGSCPQVLQEGTFVDMGSTVSHEMGHFLGLNHLSERDGTKHDPLPDTVTCSSTVSDSLTRESCRIEAGSAGCPAGTFCPTLAAYQFNHVMWYTSKAVSSTGGNIDGNLFSANSGAIINYSSLIQ